jgi:hypothetical protein
MMFRVNYKGISSADWKPTGQELGLGIKGL